MPPLHKHLPQQYAEIFDKRGRDYHEAMLRFPQARAEEFAAILKLADLQPGQTVCDFPSGGGYLEDFIKTDVSLVLLETSKVFLQCAAEHSKARRLLVEDMAIPMEDASADRFISLAGLHHIIDRRPLFVEVNRVLKPGGTFIIADVRAGSGVDRFLNIFVHEHSEEGHEGIFLTPATKAELEDEGFSVTSMQPIRYEWRFDSMPHMVEYCRLMFGITRAAPAQIEQSLRNLLGVKEEPGDVRMGWELLFVVAQKPGS